MAGKRARSDQPPPPGDAGGGGASGGSTGGGTAGINEDTCVARGGAGAVGSGDGVLTFAQHDVPAAAAAAAGGSVVALDVQQGGDGVDALTALVASPGERSAARRTHESPPRAHLSTSGQGLILFHQLNLSG